MNALTRLVQALCFALVASATVGACARRQDADPPNFRVLLSVRSEWLVDAYVDAAVPIPLQTQNWRGRGLMAYGGVLRDRPSKVIVEEVHTGLGGVDCKALQDRVEARLNDSHRSWRVVQSEATAVPGNRNRCILALSWSRE